MYYWRELQESIGQSIRVMSDLA